jgi:beta-glucosidase
MNRNRFYIIFCLFSLSFFVCAQRIDSVFIQSIEKKADSLISLMSLEEKSSQMVHSSRELFSYGISEYNWWNEALHGVARAGKATVFPQAIALAATFDPDLIERTASAISDEARAKYNLFQKKGIKGQYSGLTFWSPNVNIFRDPRWGRGQETYGEDPFLTGQIGSAFVRGLQGYDSKYLKVAACAKHFAVHSGPEKLRHSFNANVSNQDLYETYLPAFKSLIDSGVEIVMCAYNSVNGEPCCGSENLISDILRDEFDFSGHVVSDCGAINDIHSNHNFTNSNLESIAYAIKGGVDLNCGSMYADIPLAVEKGLLEESEVDKSLKRLLMTRLKLGLFEPEGTGPYDHLDEKIINSKMHIDLSRKVASESIVLLKNNGVLPLKKDLNRIFITGPNSTSLETLLGNYNGLSSNVVTPLEGILAKVGANTILRHALGVPFNDLENNSFNSNHIASSSDVIIAFMGISALIEGERGDAVLSNNHGDRKEISLPINQINFLKDLRLKANEKPIILVISSGSAIELSGVESLADAIIYNWYSGEQGGSAIADVIFGDVNPSGRLPITIPKSIDHLPEFSDYSMENRTYRFSNFEPMYPFGFGLSYSNFKYSNIKLSDNNIAGNDSLTVSFDVDNIGYFDGNEIVQLYISNMGSKFRVPKYSLKGFKKIHLKANERKRIQFILNKSMLNSIDDMGREVLNNGEFKIWISGSSPHKRSIDLGISQISTMVNYYN